MESLINVKQLRASLPEIVRRVGQGESFTVLYRSRPAFRLVPADAPPGDQDLVLEGRPLYRAEAVGRSADGMTSRAHDAVLYGKGKRAVRASFVKDGRWWVAWTEDVPGAMTQGRTIKEARKNLIDAVREVRKPVDVSGLPRKRVVVEELEV